MGTIFHKSWRFLKRCARLQGSRNVRKSKRYFGFAAYPQKSLSCRVFRFQMLISCDHKRDLLDLEFHSFFFVWSLTSGTFMMENVKPVNLKKPPAGRTQNHRMEGVFV